MSAAVWRIDHQAGAMDSNSIVHCGLEMNGDDAMMIPELRLAEMKMMMMTETQYGIMDDQPWCYLATWFDLNEARREGMSSSFLVLKSCLCWTKQIPMALYLMTISGDMITMMGA